MTPTPPSHLQPDPFANSPDPLLDEVREARQWVLAQHGNDLQKHVEALRKIQEEWGGQIISDRGTPTKQAG